jgi:hypothetical protein
VLTYEVTWKGLEYNPGNKDRMKVTRIMFYVAVMQAVGLYNPSGNPYVEGIESGGVPYTIAIS